MVTQFPLLEWVIIAGYFPLKSTSGCGKPLKKAKRKIGELPKTGRATSSCLSVLPRRPYKIGQNVNLTRADGGTGRAGYMTWPRSGRARSDRACSSCPTCILRNPLRMVGVKDGPYPHSVRCSFQKLDSPRKKSLSLGPWAPPITRQYGRRRFHRDRDLVSRISRDLARLSFYR